MKTTIAVLLVIALIAVVAWLVRRFRLPGAEIYVPSNIPLAQFRYQDIPMKECAWCGTKVNLNRHHCTSYAASPELKDDPNNIVILCRGKGLSGGCHACIGHGWNFKRFNPNIKETLRTVRWVTSDEYYKETHGGKERTEKRR